MYQKLQNLEAIIGKRNNSMNNLGEKQKRITEKMTWTQLYKEKQNH